MSRENSTLREVLAEDGVKNCLVYPGQKVREL